MAKLEFTDCPCCGQKKYTILQDKIHLDYARECVACGYSIELMPRAATRKTMYHTGSLSDDDGFGELSSDYSFESFDDSFKELVM